MQWWKVLFYKETPFYTILLHNSLTYWRSMYCVISVSAIHCATFKQTLINRDFAFIFSVRQHTGSSLLADLQWTPWNSSYILYTLSFTNLPTQRELSQRLNDTITLQMICLINLPCRNRCHLSVTHINLYFQCSKSPRSSCLVVFFCPFTPTSKLYLKDAMIYFLLSKKHFCMQASIPFIFDEWCDRTIKAQVATRERQKNVFPTIACDCKL